MRFLLLILLTALPSLATVRTWRNVDGSQSFDAEFLSTDGVRVTLKRSADNRILTFTSEKLHPDDQAWLKANSQPTPDAPEEEAPAGAAFDTLEFGDDRKTVEAKLKNSSLLSTVVDESLFGRTGLNGVYKTKATIGGLHCFLYFDWTKGGSLREVTLQTQSIEMAQYNSRLQSNWSELIQLLGKLHGNAIQEAPYPAHNELQDGLLLGSHLWYTEDGHSVILCTGQERDKYLVAVRITS
ncbi:MAG: hypothetical protein O3A92_04760, partial [Verrucomicrobia bacterium]|nr:hypothetical protein [Verrucomicrobiota bacterium]